LVEGMRKTVTTFILNSTAGTKRKSMIQHGLFEKFIKYLRVMLGLVSGEAVLSLGS
jgi:hypothetical protein